MAKRYRRRQQSDCSTKGDYGSLVRVTCGYSAVRAVCYARVERGVECHTAAGSCAALIVAASYQEVADPGTPPSRLFGPSVWTPHIRSSGKLAVTAPLKGPMAIRRRLRATSQSCVAVFSG